MQRIHFTADDLANVRVASRPCPMVETIFALQRLQGREAGILFDRWRLEAWNALRTLRHARKLLDCLLDLVPPQGFIPDFMCSVTGAADGLDSWIDHVLASPPTLVRADMEGYVKYNGRPSKWLRSLAAGDRESFSTVASALRSFYSTALGQEWASVVASVEAERASRARDLLDGGLARLLNNLPGVAYWDSPTLVTICPFDIDYYLDGRGLILVPSYYCWPAPVLITDPEATPLLAFPVQHRRVFDDSRSDAQTPLANVLGRTRAAVLETIADGGATTGEIAKRLSISPAAASWHVAALRQAGLITTVRNRYAVHTPTTLGAQLVGSHSGGIQVGSK